MKHHTYDEKKEKKDTTQWNRILVMQKITTNIDVIYSPIDVQYGQKRFLKFLQMLSLRFIFSKSLKITAFWSLINVNESKDVCSMSVSI